MPHSHHAAFMNRSWLKKLKIRILEFVSHISTRATALADKDFHLYGGDRREEPRTNFGFVEMIKHPKHGAFRSDMLTRPIQRIALS